MIALENSSSAAGTTWGGLQELTTIGRFAGWNSIRRSRLCDTRPAIAEEKCKERGDDGRLSSTHDELVAKRPPPHIRIHEAAHQGHLGWRPNCTAPLAEQVWCQPENRGLWAACTCWSRRSRSQVNSNIRNRGSNSTLRPAFPVFPGLA